MQLAWNGAEIVHDFLNGAVDFQDANNKNYEKISTSTLYNGIPIWRNNHGLAAFVGNWSGKFPSAAQTTPYDDIAAENWYNNKYNNLLDLFVSNVSVPGSAYSGSPMPVTCTISRGSDMIENSFIVRFVLSTDPYFQSASDNLLGDFNINGLHLQILTFTRSFTIPTSIAARTYYIIAYVDRLNNVAETNENNNIRASANMINIMAPVKDLFVNSVAGPSAAIRGSSIQVTCSIARGGVAIPESFIVRFVLSTSQSYNSAISILLGDVAFNALNLATCTFTRSFTIPSWITARPYYIIAYVDRLNNVAETNENNNVMASSAQITVN